MKIVFEITYADYAEASYCMGRARKDPRRPYLLVGLIGFAFGVLMLVQRPDGGGWISPATVMTLATFVLVYPYWRAHNELDRQWRNAERRVQPGELEVDDSGIEYRHALFDIHYRWNAFESFSETANLVLLFYDPTDVGLYIPKRAFASRGELSDFLALLKSNIGTESSASAFESKP